ncbi:hypothetical protein [Halorussus halophilus]|nr:hypothetical protein [Halorussus halophilus]
MQLEIEDSEDGRPIVRIQDRSVPEAWISAKIDAVVSLPECE